MKKDRKKEVKRAEEKYQILEDKLYDLRTRQQKRPYSESRFDSPGIITIHVHVLHVLHVHDETFVLYSVVGTP